MSRLNREASYVYDIDGETVWERLRVIRNFLEERRQALAVAQLGEEKREALDKDSFEYREAMIFKLQSEKLIQECKDEIKFLEDFESRLMVEAEKTRITGKTDDEMYEINYFNEVRVRVVREAQAELLSTGHIATVTMARLLRNKAAMEDCVALGLLLPEVLPQVNIQLPGQTLAVALLENKEESK
jgi:S-adenosylmethionine:diacylglycerol 3-amino-3-carboxypropyl transferase